MPISSSTDFVPSSDEYQPPERPRDRIAAILRAKLPRHVNANGVPIAGPDVTDLATPPTEPPPVAGASQPNPLHATGTGAPVPAPAAGLTALDRIAAELTRKLAPELPEGYVPAPPR